MKKIIYYTPLTLLQAVEEKKIIFYGIQKLYEELYQEYKNDIKVLKILYYSSINLEDLIIALEINKEHINKIYATIKDDKSAIFI